MSISVKKWSNPDSEVVYWGNGKAGVNVYKDTFDPKGKLVHTKNKCFYKEDYTMDFLHDLIRFKRLEIKKKELLDIVKTDLNGLNIDMPIIIESEDVIRVLELYLDNKINVQDVVDWVNIIWFSDIYEYSDYQCDSIASVMNELEEADENYEKLSKNRIEKYLNVLKKNIEFVEKQC